MFHVVFVLLFVLFLLLGVWWVFVLLFLFVGCCVFLGGVVVCVFVCFLPYRPSLWLLRFSDRNWQYTSIHDDEEDIMI